MESIVPQPFAVNGIKLGLSNIVVMYAVFVLGNRQALLLAVLKALFALFTRGAIAGAIALCGGLVSVGVMLVLLRFFQERLRYATVSMAGAVAHNVGQLLCATAILRLYAVFWYYLPLLIAAGVAAGLVTSLLLRAVMPLLATLKHP